MYCRAQGEKLGDFITTLDERDATAIDAALGELKSAADNGIEVTGQQVSPACNSSFVPAAEKMFSFYASAAVGEYASIAGYYGIDSISYGAFDTLQAIIEEVQDAQQSADAEFLKAQQDFAGDCGFKLVRNVD